MTDQPYKKKLIEVALPLDAINAESAREKSIRHGHPSTLHLWWARRPLAACRAVLFSQLVDDPSAHPDRFPTEEAQDAERERLFAIIEDLVKWENSTNEMVLERARKEIRDSCDGNPPPILDPFAGGGSIPLEAQRLGLEAHASDLNPVAVLINKALIEIPPRWAGHPPVHPEAERRTRWTGPEGLAEDVRRYGQWMRHEAERRIGHIYPQATLPDGSKANVIAWIWARTVECPNPACRATMPLVRSFWLGKKPGKETWIRAVPERRSVGFEIGLGRGGPDVEGTVKRSGAVCLCCDNAVSFDHIRTEGRAGRLGAQMMAIVAEGQRKRVYLPPNAEHVDAATLLKPASTPLSDLPERALGFRVQAYGMNHHADLFTNRQLTALTTFSDLISEVCENIDRDGVDAGLSSADATCYAKAIATYLAFGVSRLTDYCCTITTWASNPQMEILRNAFARQAIPMTWDFAEGNVFGGSSGTLEIFIQAISKSIEKLPAHSPGVVSQDDARLQTGSAVISTDPPYYDNIGYADLADFFYVWLRRTLRDAYPDLLGTIVTPKEDELIATPYRHGGSGQAAERYFEDGFIEVFRRSRAVNPSDIPMSVFYAFKQSEEFVDGEVASTGWSTMLEGLAAAGWMVTATWPMRTEKSGRSTSIGTNALASSVVLACRPRPDTAATTDRQGLIRALRSELPGPLRELQKAHIAPVDLRQASIGPGMAVYSRFAKVIEPDGSTMRVRTALGLINQVLGKVLDEQEEEFDRETRWAIQWFSQFYGDEGPYGVAESLALSMDVAVPSMVHAGILRSSRGKVRLLDHADLPDDWDPTADTHAPVWEATHHLVKALVDQGSEAAAGRLLARIGSLGDAAQLLAYRLYTVCEQARPTLAGPYNALVASWPEIQRHSREAPAPPEAVDPRQVLDFGEGNG